MKKTIITGATGFIGRQLIKRLLTNGENSLVLLSNTSNFTDKILSENKLASEHIESYNVDIRKRKEIFEIFSYEKPSTCIHLAAKTSVADSMKNSTETMDVNVNGTISILDACYNNQVNDFIFASSAAVYGDVTELPIKESSTLAPISAYGTSKMLAEAQVLTYRKVKKIKNAIVLRIFNVYGEGQDPGANVVAQFAQSLSKGLPPVIYGNGTQTRDFISVDDVVDGILLSTRIIKERNKHKIFLSSPIFNIGTGIPTSIKEVARKMIEISQMDIYPIYKEEINGMKRISHSYADIRRAKQVLGFAPKKSIDTGLTDLKSSALISKKSE
ncbi:NAD-dependent epimerase/dehydratase family protein [soil metagenome]